ncbi:MAG: D-alanine--D-alanine ligase [Bacteroidetes bacterium]|nr:MAG: D-alanine--D-alanine ligase [Bacteroidota bacterium]
MKKNIAVVTGGYSGEAVISLQSADQVMKHLDPDKYNCFKVILTKDKWALSMDEKEYPIDKNDFSATIGGKKIKFDCAFMALHGTPGEDGKLQGYFDMIGIPYTSSGVVQSALTFSKSFTVATLSRYGVNTARSIVVSKKDKVTADDILAKISIPCFVKPNEGGSSLGASKVKHKNELMIAVEKGLKEGEDVIIEEFIEGIEITCGVIRYKGKIKALAITEIVFKTEIFDFHAKYIDKATEEITPARIPIVIEAECKNLSEYIYKILGCKGMIRIDYIIKQGKLYLLEVNSIPGMTERSLLPQQAEYAGISKTELYGNAIEEVFR